MKRRARFVILGIAALLLMLVPATGLFAQAKEATVAAKKYLAVAEGLQFKAAYNLISPDDRAAKTLAQYQDENPLVFIKAMRLADKNYLRYTIKDATVEDEEVQVRVTTRDLVDPNYPDLETPPGVLYGTVKDEMQRNKLKVDDPVQVLSAFREMLADNGTTGLPFGRVTRIVRMTKVKNTWYVNMGWGEAALKAQHEETARQAQMAESQAPSAIDHAKTWPSDFSEDIQKLQALKDKAPQSKVILDGLDLLARMKKNMDLIQLEATNMALVGCRIRITNRGEFAVSFLIMEYSLLDAEGNVLKRQENFQQSLRADDPSIDPRLTDNWCPPGYSGLVSSIYAFPDDPQVKGWARTEIKLKGVMYHFD